MPKAPSKKIEARHAPLGAVLAEDELVQKFGRVSKPGKRVKNKGKGRAEEDEEVRWQASYLSLCLSCYSLVHRRARTCQGRAARERCIKPDRT